MGVPSYFFWLINNYSRKILKGSVGGSNSLFLDLNCAIHPAVKANPDFTINDMLQAVIDYINDIIYFVKDVQLIYIAIDGVAPVAKMQQQRLRRYKSKMFSESNDGIDFNMISPGTEFMRMLHEKINETYAPEIASKRIIFSSSDEPGEGEHKIFNYIRANKINTNIIIYGLDSDLIFLSLINYDKCHIYLLREKEQYGKITNTKEKYVYLDINYLRNVIYTMLRTSMNHDIKAIIMDYVFFSFFLGNDFLPCIPTLFIREGGIELLMENYTIVLNNRREYLIINNAINENFLYDYIMLLSKSEQSSIDKSIVERKKRMAYMKKNDAYVEGQKPDLIFEQFPPASWKKRHYAYYFDIIGKSEIKKIWASYLTGMLWTLRYYIGIPVAWQWYYDYTAAPAFSDFHYCIINDISFDGIPTTLEQLLLIMPRTSMHLLPKKYQIIMSNIALFPPEKEIKYCIMNKKYLHEAICYLPELKLSKIRKMIALLE